ncbi:hypothetical protein AZE42_07264 [Rhizopogon vesiculosus]|uniref:Uncharacterized protein n=1 Tax=Rhizopogon vesiculosus TaxID=180088 RepID=A0A1J8QXJ0_9AGAM|nr:hypothetical protein AZE42_07264 [Rhizopogon vesiculosus]
MTPSLLLAVLESILQSRFPIPASIHASRSSLAKVQAFMKIFLGGVLECDVLPSDKDVGLADLDLRRIAEGLGGWGETLFVGELLCLLRRKQTIIDALVGDDSEGNVDLQPQCCCAQNFPTWDCLTQQTSRATYLSIRANAPHTESETIVAFFELSDWTETQPIYNTVHHQPQCINELEDPSYVLERDASYTSIDGLTEEFDPDLSPQLTYSAQQPLTPTP